MRVRSRLMVNTVVTIACLALVGGIGLFFTNSVANMSMSLVEKEAIPILQINELETSVSERWLRLIAHSGVSEVETMQQLEQEIAQLDKQIVGQLQTIEETYAFDKTEAAFHVETLQAFRDNWQQFDNISQQILLLSQDFTKADALRVIIKKGTPAYNKIMETIRELVEQHSKDMEILRDAALTARQQATWAIITITLLIGFLVLIFINRFSNRLLAPLLQINSHLKSLAQGKPVQDEIKYQEKDEIAEIVLSSHQLKESINETIKQANAVAAGDYSREVTLRSEEDQLGRALSDMIHKLRDVTKTNEVQDWLKTGQTQLNEKLSGEQDLLQVSKNAINFIAPYVEAQIGALYLYEEGTDGFLKMKASHAYVWRKSVANQFKLGEGIVGQAALERRTIVITQPPTDYIYIQSALGDATPSAIIVMPFLHEEKLKGVIELAAFKVFTEIQIEFLKQIMPTLAIAINSTQSHQQMQILLEQTRKQAEALQNQQQELQNKQVELQQSNKELESQKQELQNKQTELQQSNEELQSQSDEQQAQAEELQSQQEELRQSNEELEERTRELERQQKEIRDKNLALEQSQIDMAKAKSAVETKAQELELASKYKSEFLANMSHELRTPLNSLLILAQLLADNRGGNLNEEQVEYAQTIHSAGKDLLTLINEILDLAKVEAGRIEVHLEKVLLKETLEKVEQKFKPIAETKGVGFPVTVAEDLPAKLTTDGQRLKQIINNLLSNAFKFTTKGEVKLTIQRPEDHDAVKFLNLDPAKTLEISVTDTGIGIPADKQQVIFEAFQQADGSTNRRYGGTGLGLSISRQLARLLGGDLQLSSEVGQGSTFILYLPEHFQNSPEKSYDSMFKLVNKNIIKY